MLALIIQNDMTGTESIGNYTYKVVVGGDSNNKVIASGKVKGHRRRDSWRSLVNMVTEEDSTKEIMKMLEVHESSQKRAS